MKKKFKKNIEILEENNIHVCNHEAMEHNGWGSVTVWLDASMDDAEREVDMPTLQLALPYGTEL